jgi:hypothetical protein
MIKKIKDDIKFFMWQFFHDNDLWQNMKDGIPGLLIFVGIACMIYIITHER